MPNSPIGLWQAVGSVYMIVVFILRSAGKPPAWLPPVPCGRSPRNARSVRVRHDHRVRRTKGCAVAAQPSAKATTTAPSYLRAAEVADILHVSPKTVSRWAKEGKLPFLKTLGGHRRYPAAEIRQLADELRVQPTA
jgi:excisionase family DNA binding protein